MQHYDHQNDSVLRLFLLAVIPFRRGHVMTRSSTGCSLLFAEYNSLCANETGFFEQQCDFFQDKEEDPYCLLPPTPAGLSAACLGLCDCLLACLSVYLSCSCRCLSLDFLAVSVYVFVSLSLYVFFFFSLSLSGSVCLPFPSFVSFRLLFICRSPSLSVSVFCLCLSACLSLSLPLCLPTCLSVYLSVYLSPYHPLFLCPV